MPPKVRLSNRNKEIILRQTPPNPPFTKAELNHITKLNDIELNNENNGKYLQITEALQNIVKVTSKRAKSIQFVKNKLKESGFVESNSTTNLSASNKPINVASNRPASVNVSASVVNESSTSNPLAGALKVFGALPPIVFPRKSCMLLGHGNTLSEEYIVLPNDIDVTFYTEKGESLSNVNNVIRTYNNNSINPNPQHHIEAKSMMFNMTIKFLAFSNLILNIWLMRMLLNQNL